MALEICQFCDFEAVRKWEVSTGVEVDVCLKHATTLAERKAVNQELLDKLVAKYAKY